MKCPKCGGDAELSNWGSLFDPDYADFHVKCKRCGYHSMGSTDPQKAQEMFEKEMGMHYTNEEWLNTLSTEKKAEFLVKIVMTAMHPVKRGGVDMEKAVEDVTEWLKKPHKESET